MRQRDENLAKEVELLRQKLEELEQLAKGRGLGGIFNIRHNNNNTETGKAAKPAWFEQEILLINYNFCDTISNVLNSFPSARGRALPDSFDPDWVLASPVSFVKEYYKKFEMRVVFLLLENKMKSRNTTRQAMIYHMNYMRCI